MYLIKIASLQRHRIPLVQFSRKSDKRCQELMDFVARIFPSSIAIDGWTSYNNGRLSLSLYSERDSSTHHVNSELLRISLRLQCGTINQLVSSALPSSIAITQTTENKYSGRSTHTTIGQWELGIPSEIAGCQFVFVFSTVMIPGTWISRDEVNGTQFQNPGFEF